MTQPSNKETPKQGKDEPRIDISTADDVNVDDDNDIGSPKKALTAEAPDESDEDTPADNPTSGKEKE